VPRPEAPFAVLGKLGKLQLEAVHELCGPGEQPRFVLADGIYGALAAFEDRCAIVKKGWLSGAPRQGVAATYPYAELSGLRFVPKTFSGTLELIPALDDYGEWRWRTRGDVQKRDDALQLSKDLYEKAQDELGWLRGRITDARRAAHPDIALVDELKHLADLELLGALGRDEFEETVRVLLERAEDTDVPSAQDAVTVALARIHAAAVEYPGVLGLEDPEPFMTALAEARAALDGEPQRLRGVLVEVLDDIGVQLTEYYGVTVPRDALAEVFAEHYTVGLAMAYGASDTDLREQLAERLAEVLVGRDAWPNTAGEFDSLRAAIERRGWTIHPDRFA
jgi:hypothetical protein